MPRGILPNAGKPLEFSRKGLLYLTVHRTHSEQETTNENQEHQKAVLLLALLTSTSFAAGKNVMLSSEKAIAALSTPAK